MWQYIDSVSADGWCHLLKAFIPTTMQLVIADLLLFVVIPLLLVFGFIGWYRKRFAVGSRGAWCTAGAIWTTGFWLSMLACVVIYFLAREVMTTSVSGMASFQSQYQASLPGGQDGKPNIKAVVAKVRNASKGKASQSINAPEYKAVYFFWSNYGYVHPIFFTLLDMVILGWFFFPGFKMKRQRIDL